MFLASNICWVSSGTVRARYCWDPREVADHAPRLVLEFDAADVAVDTLAAVKECAVEVSVTAVADGMAGAVADWSDPAVDVDVIDSLLPLGDLSLGASASASSVSTDYTKELYFYESRDLSSLP